ncbi:DUF58 domain-containing protein [Peribacillus sp. SCS-26]|uniref:DUF58 domain-containing protein n=1 Tax=Paraperibacillus marinus TaxID=3115295 RepID=UPI003906765B
MKKMKPAILAYLKFALLIVLVLAAFAYAMFQGGFVSWFVFYSFLPFAVYSLLLFLYPISDFHIERELNRSECRAGDSLRITIKMRRRLAFPLLYMVVEEDLPGKLVKSGVHVERELIFPWFKKEFVFSYDIVNIIRGEYDFTSISIKTGDLLGLFEKKASFSLKETVLVYPSYYELPFSQIGTQYNQGQNSSTVKVQREVSTLSGIREYQPGDRFAWINWKATAKRSEIMTKEFEQKKSQDIFVLLDTSRQEGFEPLISMTASIVRTALKRGVPVGFFSPGLMERPLPLQAGEGQRQRISRYLARAEYQDSLTVESVLQRENPIIPFNVSLLIATGMLDEEMIKKLGTNKHARTITFAVLKTDISLTQKEIKLQQQAQQRGMHVVYLGEQAALSEVIGS